MVASLDVAKFSTYYNQANHLYRSGYYKQALDTYLLAMEKNVKHFGVRYNLGGLYKNCGQFELAIKLLEPLLVEYPESSKLILLLYCCYMAIGDYNLACKAYWMLHPRPHLPSKDSRIYIQAVDGVGDELLFAPSYCASGHKHYTVECDRRLKNMLRLTYPTIDWVDRKNVPREAWLRDADVFHMHLGAMPGRSVPALAVNHKLAEETKCRYNRKYGPRHRVGVSAFSGGVDAALRMPEVSFWEKLISENPHCIFFDLQQSAFDLTSIDALEHIPDVDLYHDFDNLAAILAAMDSVISIDNTIANLSTALKIPTTVINYPGTHWRWKMDPLVYRWFENTKCYYQTDLGCWDFILESLIMDLKDV